MWPRTGGGMPDRTLFIFSLYVPVCTRWPGELMVLRSTWALSGPSLKWVWHPRSRLWNHQSSFEISYCCNLGEGLSLANPTPTFTKLHSHDATGASSAKLQFLRRWATKKNISCWVMQTKNEKVQSIISLNRLQHKWVYGLSWSALVMAATYTASFHSVRNLPKQVWLFRYLNKVLLFFSNQHGDRNCQ